MKHYKKYIMPKLWTFGDSFTESFLPKEDCKVIHWRHHYIDWKGYVPKVYGEFLSERLDMKLMNFGMGSWDNYSIFESFCKVVNQIEKNDLVIFGWSSLERFRIVNNGGYWHQLAPSYDRTYPIPHSLSERTIDEIFINRTHQRYSDEVNNWIKLINYTLKRISVIHWTPFINNIQATYLSGFPIIRDETNGIVNDGHFSEKGQEELSKILEAKYNRIKNKEII